MLCKIVGGDKESIQASWKPAELTTVLWCMGTKYAFNQDFYSALIDIVLDHESGEGPLPGYEDWQSCFKTKSAAVQLGWSLARSFVGHNQNVTYPEQLGECAKFPFKSCTDRQTAFDKMNVYRYFRRLEAVENDVLFEMSLEALSQLVTAFATIRIVPEDVVERACAVIGIQLDKSGSRATQFLADTVWSLSILNKASNPIFGKCIQKLASVQSSLNLPTALRILQAIIMSGEVDKHIDFVAQALGHMSKRRSDPFSDSVAHSLFPALLKLKSMNLSGFDTTLIADAMINLAPAYEKIRSVSVLSKFHGDVKAVAKRLSKDIQRDYVDASLTEGLKIDHAIADEKVGVFVLGDFACLRDGHGDFIGYAFLFLLLFLFGA